MRHEQALTGVSGLQARDVAAVLALRSALPLLAAAVAALAAPAAYGSMIAAAGLCMLSPIHSQVRSSCAYRQYVYGYRRGPRHAMACC